VVGTKTGGVHHAKVPGVDGQTDRHKTVALSFAVDADSIKMQIYM